MDWVTRLNLGPTTIPLGCGQVDILHWAYNSHLVDNEPHRHTFFEVCLVGNYGRGIFTNLGKPIEIGPGDLFIARPGALHRIVNVEQPLMELSWVSYQWHGGRIGQSDVDSIMRAFDESPIVYVEAQQARPVSILWKTIESLAGDDAIVDAQLAHLTSALVLAVSQAATSTRRMPEARQVSLRESTLRLALRYIEDNLDQELSVPQIATYIAVSPRQISRIFRELVNTSPAEYVSRARLDRAATLLRSTDRPVKDIAAQVGIPDVHHFTRVFARYAGVPPSAYRHGVDTSNVPKRQNSGRLV